RAADRRQSQQPGCGRVFLQPLRHADQKDYLRQWHPDHHLVPVQRQGISGGIRQQRQPAQGIPLPPAEDVDDGPAVPADGRQSGVLLSERSSGGAATTDQEQWGDRLASVDPDSSIENNLRFSGQYYDQETGLHQNYFRDYDPRTANMIMIAMISNLRLMWRQNN